MGGLPHAPRIVVVGTSSVGKSTFARALAALRASGEYAHLTWVEFKRPAEAERWLRQLGLP